MRNTLRSLVPFILLVIVSMGLFVGCALSNHHRKVQDVRRADLAEHRRLQLLRLHAYTENGVFPHNPNPNTGRVHMFKDAFGTRCAVANLVYQDGLEELVDRMAIEHNDVVVADETSGPLHDWVLTSGLTNEEVRRIQGAGFEFDGRFLHQDIARTFAERERLQTELRAVERDLTAATDASLEIALTRLEKTQPRVASLF